MIRTLQIQNFRAFRDFRMENLGRVNLCVGTNNCGKTSVLEALAIHAANATPNVLYRTLARRGERHSDDDPTSRATVDVTHLFHGHRLSVGAKFAIGIERLERTSLLEVEAHPARDPRGDTESRRNEEDLIQIMAAEADGQISQKLELVVSSSNGKSRAHRHRVPLTVQGGLEIDHPVHRIRHQAQGSLVVTQFLTTDSINRREVVTLFERVVLTPEEQMVIDALRTIEPEIERIAPFAAESGRLSSDFRGGFYVKMKKRDDRIPIGSFGDGIWRMLGVALSLVKARDGLLLVDEIDTGLHHTVMADLWRLVYETAKRLDVQVFATTHSRDCVDSLAAIARPDAHEAGEISIQRIERGKDRAISYSEGEIVIAAERGIEVR